MELLNSISQFYNYILTFIKNITFSEIFILVLVIVFGVILGSFLTMLIYRLFKVEEALFSGNKKEAKEITKGILLGRSYCPKCNTQLKWYHNIPIFSYLFLGGKCAYCKEKIPMRYFLIELFLGILFILFYIIISYYNYLYVLNNLITTPFYFIISVLFFILIALLYGLVVYDIMYLYLSNIINYIGYITIGIISIFILFGFSNFYQGVGILGIIFLFILLGYLFFYILDILGKIYYGFKNGFKNTFDLEIIGLGDYYALFPIFYLMGFFYSLRYVPYLKEIDFSLSGIILNKVFYDTLFIFSNFILVSAIITIVYYIISSFILGYKNNTQKELDDELLKDGIEGISVPFLPGLVFAGVIMLLYIAII